LKEGVGHTAQRKAEDDGGIIVRLEAEVGLSKEEAAYYVKLIRNGSAEASANRELSDRLSRKGMVILSGNGKRIIPVHPRLGLANHYRTWREGVVREINERRMRMDKLILELIPAYEAATEKRADEEAR